MNENKTSRVAFERRAVWIDGVETRILAGTMHYFRQPREYSRERMEKAAAMGLNAIETYLQEWRDLRFTVDRLRAAYLKEKLSEDK